MRLFIFLSLLAYGYATDWQCGYQPPDPSTVVTQVRLDSDLPDLPRNGSERNPRAASEWKPMRILTHHDPTIEGLDPATKQKLKSAVQEAVNYWQSTLSVRRAAQPLRLERTCRDYILTNFRTHRTCLGACGQSMCATVPIPDQHLPPCHSCPPPDATGRIDMKQCTLEGVPYDKRDTALAARSDAAYPGVSADFILYVTTSGCEGRGKATIASAQHCQLESSLDRPIAGVLNVCKLAFNHDTVNTMKHEILHALVFSPELFKYFRQGDGTPYMQRNQKNNKPTDVPIVPVTEKITRTDWAVKGGKATQYQTVEMVVTPLVKKEAQEHFNCPTLEGAELEGQGGPGSAGAHWEKRLFRNEMLTASDTKIPPVITRITLALLEDSGWYKADYRQASRMQWGRGLGCGFAQKSCGEWIATRRKAGKSPTPFCDRVDTSLTDGTVHTHRCSSDRKSMGKCDIKKSYGALPKRVQYFDKVANQKKSEAAKFGGAHKFMDYCPYVQELPTRIVCDGSSGAENRKYNMQEFGASSRCIDIEGAWTKVGHTLEGGCYKTKCYSTAVYIEMMGRSYKCEKNGEGTKIAIDEIDHYRNILKGNLICPAYEEICDGSGYPNEPAPPHKKAPPTKAPPPPPPKKTPPTKVPAPPPKKNPPTKAPPPKIPPIKPVTKAPVRPQKPVVTEEKPTIAPLPDAPPTQTQSAGLTKPLNARLLLHDLSIQIKTAALLPKMILFLFGL